MDLFETVDMVIKVNGDDGTEKRKKVLNDIRYDKKNRFDEAACSLL